MTTLVDIQLEIDEDSSWVDDVLARQSSDVRQAKERLVNLIEGFGRRFTGKISAHIDTATNYTKASGTLTFVSAVNTDVFTIGGTTFTIATSPSGESQIAVGGSDAAMGALVTAAVNAHSALKGVVTASDNGAGVVTITAALPGRIGNAIHIASPDSTITAGAAQLAGATVVEKTALVTHSYGK